MTHDRKLITVFGATGAQGGSVVQSLLRDKSGSFHVRAISRNPSSKPAISLEESGVEVVKADGFDPVSLRNAFEGSWGAFVNTNGEDPAFEHENAPTHTDLGKNIMDAAAKAGVKHLIYSGTPSTSEVTNGAMPVAAFEEKYAIGEYARSLAAFSSVTIVSAGWYMENFLDPNIASVFGGFPFEEDQEGFLTYRLPRWGGKEHVPFIAIRDDFGDIVHGVFLEPQKWDRKFVQAVSDIRSFDTAVTTFEEVTGKKARFVKVPWRDFETHGIKGLESIKQMFGFLDYSEGRYYGVETEIGTAQVLKKSAVKAQARPDSDGNLLMVRAWFGKEFGSHG